MNGAPTGSLPPSGGGLGRGGALASSASVADHAPAAPVAAARPSPRSASAESPSPRRGEGAELLQRAKAMRSAMSVPEAIVWKMLRAKHLNGWKFTRQVPIGPYIADFVARREKLVVEIDGHSHDATTAYDARRDAVMVALGYHVLRTTNSEIATNLDGVSRAIDNQMRRLAPTPRNP